MKRKLLGIACTLVLASMTIQPSYCASAQVFAQYYDAAQNYLAQGQYSSAIVDFRKALRINYMDSSARIGLINSYLARATYYANQQKDYEKAANDFRSAIFYLKMYPTKEQAVANSASMIASANENLNQCLKVVGFDRTPSNRYKKAEELRATGNFSASAYEFMKSAENESIAGDANAQIADLMKLLGNEMRSADYYKTALDLKPNDGLLRMKYARTLDKLGRYDEAVVQYNYALANSKGDMEVLYALERIYLKKLAQTPSDADLNANIGAIKQAQGNFEEALNYYNKAEQLNPNNVNTRLNVGTLYQQKKDYQKALKAYDSVLTLYPDNVQANLYKAQALSEMGDKKAAVDLYKKVLSLDPANPAAKAEIVVAMQDTMSPQEFISYLSQHSDDKTMQDMLYEYAYKLHKDNRTKDAIGAYKAVISSNPSNVNAYINLAMCYVSNKDYKSAQNILNTAKSKFPSNKLVIKTLDDVQEEALSVALDSAGELLANKEYKKALNEYMAIVPATEDSLLGVAACYQLMENYDKAVEYYKKAFLINPKNAQIPYYIGRVYYEQQKWTEAETYLKKSIALNPESDAKELLNYVAQNIINDELNEGVQLYQQKKLEAALAKFDDVLKKDANNTNAHYYKALTYDDLEKYKEAYKCYNDFASVYTTDDECLQYVKSRLETLKSYAN